MRALLLHTSTYLCGCNMGSHFHKNIQLVKYTVKKYIKSKIYTKPVRVKSEDDIPPQKNTYNYIFHSE
jgi:hypothetical protein